MAQQKVNFKRGTSAALKNLSPYVAGAFYLTTDTDKLYYANSATDLRELCKDVFTVDFVSTDSPGYTQGSSTLPSDPTIGQIYYVSGSNILCVYNGDEWTQINTPSVSYTLGSEINSTVITLTDSNNSSSNIALAAGTNITLDGATKDKITIGHASISTSKPAATETGTVSEFTVVDDITVNNGHVTNVSLKKVTVPIPETPPDSIANKSVAVATAADGSLTVSVTDTQNVTKTGTLTNGLYHKITVDGTETTKYNQASLGSFYSATKVDSLIAEKMKDINAMVYRGTVGSGEGSVSDSLPTEGVQIGDTYLVSGVVSDGETGWVTGDILIATGEEDENGVITGDITWTWIPSGKVDTTYSFGASDNKITLTNDVATSNKTQDVSLVGDTWISAIGANNTVTISHNSPSTGTALSAEATDNGSAYGTTITYVTGVSADTNGHITGITTGKYTVPADNTIYWDEF